jgi:hypothetical protein
VKALTLWQPWATLIAIGAKTIETRSWATDYRGPLAIHAAKRSPRLNELTPEIEDALVAAGVREYGALPVGCVVATCNLAAIFPTGQTQLDGLENLDEHIAAQRAFGDFSPGRFGCLLTDILPVNPPVIVRGARNLWDVSDALRDSIADVQRMAEGVFV